MNAFAAHFAVVAGRDNAQKRAFDLNYGLFHGTAFGLAPDLFLTAAHVLQAAQSDGKVAVARLTRQGNDVELVQDVELFDRIDLALMVCPGLRAEILPFHFSALNFLEDFVCFGYPFGLEPPRFYLRAFKGHVVTRRTLTILPAQPPGYELSLVPPPGLSGAPVLVGSATGTPEVAGMILQHHTAEFQGRQMDLGIALDIEELLTLDSKIIGGSIAELVFKRARVTRPSQP